MPVHATMDAGAVGGCVVTSSRPLAPWKSSLERCLSGLTLLSPYSILLVSRLAAVLFQRQARLCRVRSKWQTCQSSTAPASARSQQRDQGSQSLSLPLISHPPWSTAVQERSSHDSSTWCRGLQMSKGGSQICVVKQNRSETADRRQFLRTIQVQVAEVAVDA